MAEEKRRREDTKARISEQILTVRTNHITCISMWHCILKQSWEVGNIQCEPSIHLLQLFAFVVFILSIWVTTATTSPQSHNLEPGHPPGFTEKFVSQTCLIAHGKRNSALDISTNSQNLVNDRWVFKFKETPGSSHIIYYVLRGIRQSPASWSCGRWKPSLNLEGWSKSFKRRSRWRWMEYLKLETSWN